MTSQEKRIIESYIKEYTEPIEPFTHQDFRDYHEFVGFIDRYGRLLMQLQEHRDFIRGLLRKILDKEYVDYAELHELYEVFFKKTKLIRADFIEQEFDVDIWGKINRKQINAIKAFDDGCDRFVFTIYIPSKNIDTDGRGFYRFIDKTRKYDLIPETFILRNPGKNWKIYYPGIRIVEEYEMPEYIYHLVERRNRDSISRYGLTNKQNYFWSELGQAARYSVGAGKSHYGRYDVWRALSSILAKYHNIYVWDEPGVFEVGVSERQYIVEGKIEPFYLKLIGTRAQVRKKYKIKSNPTIIAYHGALEFPEQIEEYHGFGGFHVGSKKAAKARLSLPALERDVRRGRGKIFKVVINARKLYIPEGNVLDERNAEDRTELWVIQQLKSRRDRLRKLGYDVVPFINGVEDPGSTSYMIIEPDIVQKIGEYSYA